MDARKSKFELNDLIEVMDRPDNGYISIGRPEVELISARSCKIRELFGDVFIPVSLLAQDNSRTLYIKRWKYDQLVDQMVKL